MRILFKSILAFAACFSMYAQAGVILQGAHDSGVQVAAFKPAQSFMAEDAHIKFAFYYRSFNKKHPVDTIRLRLLDGDGDGPSSTVLATVDFILPANFEGFYDVDFSALKLAVGNMYTAALSIPNASHYWGASYSGFGDTYANGRRYTHSGDQDANVDMTFRVTPLAPAEPGQVPEPASLALVGLGLAGVRASRRRMQR